MKRPSSLPGVVTALSERTSSMLGRVEVKSYTGRNVE